MIHPLLGKLATEPQLLAEHASAYAVLATLEAVQAGRVWRRQMLASAACALAALLALAFTGLAAMLFAALPGQAMPAPWALAGLPAALWLVAGALWWLGRSRQRPQAFAHLRQQWAADAQLLREVAPPP